MTNDETTIPSPADVAELELKVADDGFTPHEAEITNLVAHATRVGAPATVLQALASPHGGEFARSQALMWIAQDWPYYERRLSDLVRVDEPTTIELVDAWRSHDDLKKSDADVRQLWGSKRLLDAVREGVRDAAHEACA